MTKRLLIPLALLYALAAPPALAESLPPLPKDSVIELPVPPQGDQQKEDLVVILSGDGGWADLDKQLGATMTARGYSVVGVDCRKYFSQTRSPDQTAADISAVLSHYLSLWQKKRVVLIGFSFGGAVEPFVLSRLPDTLKSKIALAALLSTNTYANWEVRWGDWLKDSRHESARDIVPEMSKLSAIKTLCVFGSEERKESLCLAVPHNSVDTVELPGGHHFDGDYPKLADLILRNVPPAAQ